MLGIGPPSAYNARCFFHPVAVHRWPMSVPGKEIFRCYDEWGPIRVHELRPYRYLAFGDGGEQSCVLHGAPAQLVHQYAQAMMLSLLMVERPRSVMVLGLGAGCLVSALLALPDLERVTAVELRPKVVSVAKEWFGFAPDQRLTLVLSEAGAYLQGSDGEHDLLFGDLYNDEGMEALQLAPDFLADCYNQLHDEGVLVLNLWDNGNGVGHDTLVSIHELFDGGCCLCPVEEGNIVLYAFKGRAPQLSERRQLAAAKQRGKQLGFPLQRLLGAVRAV